MTCVRGARQGKGHDEDAESRWSCLKAEQTSQRLAQSQLAFSVAAAPGWPAQTDGFGGLNRMTLVKVESFQRPLEVCWKIGFPFVSSTPLIAYSFGRAYSIVHVITMKAH